MQYLNLVKNDNINPWMNILKSAAQSQAQVLMPLSCHFYLHNKRSKAAYRYKTQMSMAPMLKDEEDEAETFAGMVLMQTQAKGLNLATGRQKVGLGQ